MISKHQRRKTADGRAGVLPDYRDFTKLIDGGDEIVLIMHERARMRASNTVLERDLPTIWTVRGSRAVRFRVFKTRDQALEAVALRA